MVVEYEYNLSPVFAALVIFVGIGALLFSANMLGGSYTFRDLIGINIPFIALALYGNILCNIEVITHFPNPNNKVRENNKGSRRTVRDEQDSN